MRAHQEQHQHTNNLTHFFQTIQTAMIDVGFSTNYRLFSKLFSLYFPDGKNNEFRLENVQLFQKLFCILTLGVPGVCPWPLLSQGKVLG